MSRCAAHPIAQNPTCGWQLSSHPRQARGSLLSMATVIDGEKRYIDAFFKLTLRPAAAADVFPLFASLTAEQRRDIVELADSNHVVIRIFEVINRIAGNRGYVDVQTWAMSVLARERAPISTPLPPLHPASKPLEPPDHPLA